MLLWTIQTEPAFERLQRHGRLRGDWRRVDPFSRGAYRWVAQAMTERIGPPPRPGGAPMWAWYQWGEGHTRPDLRFGGHLPRGQHGVRIEVEIEAEQTLLSDFTLWHHVLNYWYLPHSEADGAAFDRLVESKGLPNPLPKPFTDPALHDRVVRSWERLFDLSVVDEYVTGPAERKSIQATFWELRLEDVRAVTHFRAQ